MSREKITKSSIGIDAKNVNLLKCSTTTAKEPETFDEVDYSESLIKWLRDIPRQNPPMLIPL